MKYSYLFLLIVFVSSNAFSQAAFSTWAPYDESAELAASAKNSSERMRYKLIQSKVSDRNKLLKSIQDQLKGFTTKDYEGLAPLILEQDIPSLQASIKSGKLSYQKLTQWYLYRIAKFESDSSSYLNNIIAINPNAVAQARQHDQRKSENDDLIYGIPVLLKDNISTAGMATTAGAVAFANNMADNAFISNRLLAKGAIILGKTNLSEWANYLCLVCPNGYSAIGGQTLNPYGRKKLDTGGSSSGSGSAVAANFAPVAIGTETSGSILSPSSANSIVGLKPTTGLLSRSGIVPISSTFDTPGPMTKNVTDNVILLTALLGKDESDPATAKNPENAVSLADVKQGTLQGMRFGVFPTLLRDSIFKLVMERIESLGGVVVQVEPGAGALNGFGTILSADMRQDLPNYIKTYGSDKKTFTSVDDIVAFNKLDTLKNIPYGQGRFEGILKTNITADSLVQLKRNVHDSGVAYFTRPMEANQLNAMLSINNYHAGFAAAANFPCLTVPIGYRANGEPVGITFIAKPFSELMLLKIGYAFEQATHARKLPDGYH